MALLRDTVDTSIKSERDVKDAVDETVIGGIAYDPEGPKNRSSCSPTRAGHAPRRSARCAPTCSSSTPRTTPLDRLHVLAP